MKTFLSIGQAANLLEVYVFTMRRWEKEGKLSSDKRTFGLHRRYEKEKLEKMKKDFLWAMRELVHMIRKKI